jgi:hypothetical protein
MNVNTKTSNSNIISNSIYNDMHKEDCHGELSSESSVNSTEDDNNDSSSGGFRGAGSSRSSR